MSTIPDLIPKDKLYVKWRKIEPTEEILKKFGSMFNSSDFFWNHFSLAIPEIICPDKIKTSEGYQFAFAEKRNSEFIWQYHEDHWPYESICQILDDDLRYAVFWIRDNRTYCAWHGYIEITNFTCAEPPR